MNWRVLAFVGALGLLVGGGMLYLQMKQLPPIYSTVLLWAEMASLIAEDRQRPLLHSIGRALFYTAIGFGAATIPVMVVRMVAISHSQLLLSMPIVSDFDLILGGVALVVMGPILGVLARLGGLR